MNDLMQQYMKDWSIYDKPCMYWEYRYRIDNKWLPLTSHPDWHDDAISYRRVSNLRIKVDIEIPMPVTSALPEDSVYYVPIINVVERDQCYSKLSWSGDRYDHAYLSKGLVHLTKEGAIQHAEALISLTKI